MLQRGGIPKQRRWRVTTAIPVARSTLDLPRADTSSQWSRGIRIDKKKEKWEKRGVRVLCGRRQQSQKRIGCSTCGRKLPSNSSFTHGTIGLLKAAHDESPEYGWAMRKAVEMAVQSLARSNTIGQTSKPPHWSDVMVVTPYEAFLRARTIKVFQAAERDIGLYP